VDLRQQLTSHRPVYGGRSSPRIALVATMQYARAASGCKRHPKTKTGIRRCHGAQPIVGRRFPHFWLQVQYPPDHRSGTNAMSTRPPPASAETLETFDN